MKYALTLTLGLALVLAGCSIFNAPDRSQILPPPDAGTDGGNDASLDAGDAGTDGGADAEVDARVCTPENTSTGSTCSDFIDNDCDGLVDCRETDPDGGCARAPACCSVLNGRNWSENLRDWIVYPDSAVGDIHVIAGGSSGPDVVQFGGGSAERALRFDECQTMALGLELTVDFRLGSGLASCGGASGPDCNRASLVLTRALATSGSTDFVAEMRVDVLSNGDVAVEIPWGSVSQRRTIWSAATATQDLTLRVSISPGLVDGQAAIVATAWTRFGAGADTILMDPTPVDRLPGDLAIDPGRGCGSTSPGLYVVVEGVGSGVEVAEPKLESLQCGYETTFASAGTAVSGDVVARATMSVEGAAPWASGGIGAPSLVALDPAVGGVEFLLAFDATSEQRDYVGANPLFVLGRSYSLDRSPFWSESAFAVTWPDLATCMAPPCSSAREPFLYRGSDVYYGVFAQDAVLTGATVHSGVYDIFGFRYTVLDFMTPVMPAIDHVAAILHPVDVGCDSLGDPALVPAHDPDTVTASRATYWLLFTCMHESTPTIDAVELDATLSPIRTAGVIESKILVDPAGNATFATGGVRGAEPLVHFDADVMTMRLWFIAEDAMHDTHVGLVEGHSTGPGLLPTLEPYPINPVLDGSTPIVFSPDPRVTRPPLCDVDGMMGAICRVESLTVAQPTADRSKVTILVARRVNSPPPMTDFRFDLVPLEQDLEPFWVP